MKGNKFLILGVLMVTLMAISAMTVSAAVTSCINAAGAAVVDDTGGWPAYNDTGVVTNVGVGKVCINAVDYNVSANSSGFCSDAWAAYVDGACTYASYYVGYSGDGSATCVATGWTVHDPVVQITQGYIINTTVNALISANYITNTGEAVPAKNACLNAYTRMGPNGYCSGGTTLDTNSSLANVTAGNVCIAGADTNPTVAVKCATWYGCIAGACSVQDYYVGYAGTGAATCVATDWVSSGTPGNVAQGTVISITANASSCTASSTASLAYSTCSNLYTRAGTDGLCNGAGSLNLNTTHVAAGKVCIAGANAVPTPTNKCGTWSNCVAEATSYPTYSVGYTATGTACSATAWNATGSTVSLPSGRRILVTEVVESCHLGGYAGNSYTKSDFKNIVVDGMGTGGAEFVNQAELIVIALFLLFAAGIVVAVKMKFK